MLRMKHDVTFVTGIYDDLSTTEFSGRHNRGTHYAFSLAQIHEMGAPIYCFTDKTNMYRYFPAFMHFGYENFKFINYNLEDSPFYERIQAVKKSKPELYITSLSWSTRCVEIMWGKFDWLLNVIDRIGIKEDKYLYWIDCGLSHEGVIPTKYNSRKPKVNFHNQSHEYSYLFCNDLIFNEDFPDFLVEYTGPNKLFHFLCTNPQHNDDSHLPKTGIFRGTTVGGLFGGDISLVKQWATEAKAVCDELLAKGFIIKEEDILTHLLNKHSVEGDKLKDKLTLYKFDTWYHEDWDVYNPAQKSFSHFFEGFTEFRRNK